MALEYAGKPRLTRAQKYEIVQTVHANISGQVLLLNSLEKLNQGVGLLKAIGRKGGR